MVKGLKRIALQMMAGANAFTVAALLMTGYAGHINPETSPWLTNAGLIFPAFLVINMIFLVFWLLFKPVGAVIPFIGMLMAFVPIRQYMPMNIPRQAPDDAIKILSYNVWAFGTDRNADGTSPIVRYITDSDADIICLQESSKPYDIQQQFDSLLYNKYQYHDTLKCGDSEVIEVISKFRIKSKEKIDYISEGNLSGAFQLEIDGKDVLVINNHLETTGLTLEERKKFKEMLKGDINRTSAREQSILLIDKLGTAAKTRAPEARSVASYIRKHAYQSIICTGDFNDGPLSYAHKVIHDELTDCYIASGNGPGISYHLSGFYVRIDNIFCSSDWQPYACKVDNSIQSSDHYPIVCFLKKKDPSGRNN